MPRVGLEALPAGDGGAARARRARPRTPRRRGRGARPDGAAAAAGARTRSRAPRASPPRRSRGRARPPSPPAARRAARRRRWRPVSARWASASRAASRASTGISGGERGGHAGRSDRAAAAPAAARRGRRSPPAEAAATSTHRPQAEHAAVRDRLGGDVEPAQRRHRPATEHDGHAVAHHERVDDRDHDRERHRPQQRPRHRAARPARPPPRPARRPPAARPAAAGARTRAPPPRAAGTTARRDAGTRGVQRARAARWSRLVRPRRVPAAGCRRRPRSRARSAPSAAPRSAPPRPRPTPTSSVPVTTQVGACPSTLVAATRPAPARSVRTGSPSASSTSIASPVLARPREHAGGRRPALEPARDAVRAHVRPAADEHAQDLLPADCSITERETASTPAPAAASSTSSHERSASPAHTSLTGKRLPSRPVGNGSGNEPTTAGTRWAASHRWWSHHTRSPALRRRSAAPTGASMPLT